MSGHDRSCHKGKIHMLLVSKPLSKKPKLNIYNTVIRSILAYGREAWHLTQNEEDKLLVVEKKVFPKILGPVRRRARTLKIRTNADVQELAAQPNITQETKAYRLRWRRLGYKESISRPIDQTG